nr:hypothetical protein CFP56_52245 [Quercus suber]
MQHEQRRDFHSISLHLKSLRLEGQSTVILGRGRQLDNARLGRSRWPTSDGHCCSTTLSTSLPTRTSWNAAHGYKTVEKHQTVGDRRIDEKSWTSILEPGQSAGLSA